jgi:hypothetical protein
MACGVQSLGDYGWRHGAPSTSDMRATLPALIGTDGQFTSRGAEISRLHSPIRVRIREIRNQWRPMAKYRIPAFVLAVLVCAGSVTAAEKGDREPARQVPGPGFEYEFELLRDRVELRGDRVERQNVLPGLPSSILELPVPPAATAVSPPLTRPTVFTAEPASPGPSEGAMVAQKVVLYEEDQVNPSGKQFVGFAVWRTDRVPPGLGQKPEVAVRADIEIPERNIAIRWSLKRNDDKSLPASHTIEIMFTLPVDFPHGSISNIPGVLMKQGETTRGVPLNGVAVKVTTNFFLIGLSSVDADMQRNILAP